MLRVTFVIPLALATLIIPFAARVRFGASDPFIPHRWVRVSELPIELAIYESVFWEPLDTEGLRKLLLKSPLVRGKTVLEVGTGSGLLALCCWRAGASKVTATDINPRAIICAQGNASRLGAKLDLRCVTPEATGAFSVIGPTEKFDLIVSNPPWEDGAPRQWSDYALYDPDFALLRSLLAGLREHLNPGGKLLLAYGCVDAIKAVQHLSAEFNMQVLMLDERVPENLPAVFLPGMTLGINPDSGID